MLIGIQIGDLGMQWEFWRNSLTPPILRGPPFPQNWWGEPPEVNLGAMFCCRKGAPSCGPSWLHAFARLFFVFFERLVPREAAVLDDGLRHGNACVRALGNGGACDKASSLFWGCPVSCLRSFMQKHLKATCLPQLLVSSMVSTLGSPR